MCKSNPPGTGAAWRVGGQAGQPARSEAIRRLVELGLKVKGKVMQNLLLGVGIDLVGTLVVLTGRYVATLLAG
jgi:glycine/D-amino acid oxidase-like deaminating enzyme